MINICQRYSENWSFKFSAGKSKLLHFGKRLVGRDLLLYNEPIPVSTSAKHVGIHLDTSPTTLNRTSNVCKKLRSTTFSIIRLGVHPAVMNPLVCAKLIKQVCYPKALYGCELWGKLTNTEWNMLERTHRYICKNIQGLPRLTRTDMCLSLLGWTSIKSFVNERKLLFLGRVCNLPPTSISLMILI